MGARGSVPEGDRPPGPPMLRPEHKSPQAQPESYEQGQDLRPQGVVEMLPARGAGKAGQAGSLRAADERARGPSLVFSSQASGAALLSSASRYLESPGLHTV